MVPPSWPPGHHDRDAVEFFLARLAEGGTRAMGWYAWYAVLRAADRRPRTLIASAGYMGPPDSDGTVEIGYSVVPEERGRGYATEIVQALITRAFAQGGIRRVVAEVHEHNAASLKVIERCGFQRVADGREQGHHRYEHRRDAHSPPE